MSAEQSLRPTRPRVQAPIERLEVRAYRVPTDALEADGTFSWDATTMVLVRVEGGGEHGLGYSYTAAAAGHLVDEMLAAVVCGRDALDVPGAWAAMVAAVRNVGRPGLASMAIAAVDAALWDLKARLLGQPLAALLGRAHDAVPAYGSGGFTSYSDEQLAGQLRHWASEGMGAVKMKVGTDPADDPRRVALARQAIGDDVELYVDANGAYTRTQALALAERFAEEGVTWFEEPVSSDDLEGLRMVRDRAPAGMDVAAGEYGWDLHYFRRMLDAGAVDVLQADATRCAGITGFLGVAPLCEARSLGLSAHTSPALHLHPCLAVRALRPLEYFHDHARIERLFFDGAPEPVDGRLVPDLDRPGLGIELREADADPYRI